MNGPVNQPRANSNESWTDGLLPRSDPIAAVEDEDHETNGLAA
jgi:hypothetical protein